MKNDTLIRMEGMDALTERLGLVEAERFITLIQREPFDYTRWREENLFKGKSLEEIHAEAAALRAETEKAGEIRKTGQIKSRPPGIAKKPTVRRRATKRPAYVS